MTPDRTSTMRPVRYDDLAATYDGRYTRYDWGIIESRVRRFVQDGNAALEVGCGTGHWLGVIADDARRVVGIDLSPRMLQRARAAAPRAILACATAERLPVATASVDRVVCVHALHHFPDKPGFIRECRRVLRPGGGFLAIGLDPHTGLDDWWIYDYCPGALAADRARYAPTAAIRALLSAAGFRDVSTEIVQHIVAQIPYDEALRSGVLERQSGSQLMVISDDEYASAMNRLQLARPTLRSDLRLFATTGSVPVEEVDTLTR